MSSDDLLALLNLGEYGPPAGLFNSSLVPSAPIPEESQSDALLPVSSDVVIPPELFPNLDNLVASAHMNVAIDLKALTFRVRNAEYNPRKVNACVVRLRSPKCTLMLYGPGKVMVTGARSPEDAALAVRKAAKLLVLAGYKDAKISDFRVENIVGSCDIRFPVRLEVLAAEWKTHTSYEPEIFPGLVFRMHAPKVSVLVFVSGKVVFAGARNMDEMNLAFTRLYPVLHKFRR